MPLSLSAQNFLDVFAPSPTNVSSLEQEDPSSNSSQILDWIAEVLDTQSLDWGEPPLRVRNSLRNIGTANEVLFDGLMRLLRFHLNNQGRQLAQSMAESSQRISNVPGLFEWIVSARQKSIYFASLAALVAEQVRLVTRCINAIFQATAMDPVVFLGLRECGRLSGFHVCSSRASCLHVDSGAKCSTGEHIYPFVKEEATSCWREYHRHHQVLHFNRPLVSDNRPSWRLAG
ncbi:hypothetical protein KL923_002574 [Ogataea haglerorum]|nr:hypothetical protein KL923_002574 [Ogataea haglerorum]